MTNRRGVLLEAYVPNELKESLRRRAAADHRTLSQEITRILTEAVHGQGCRPECRPPPGDSTLRAAAHRPAAAPRSEDLPYVAATARKAAARL